MIDTNKQYSFASTLHFASAKDDDDLTLIHEFADTSTQLDEFVIVSMTAITDSPVLKDGLRLIVSREYQEKHLNGFVGLPLVRDHSSKTSDSLGRIFKSELFQDGDTTSTRVWGFIPKLPDNQSAIDRIRMGQDKEVSLGFRFSNFEEVEIDGIPHVRILPSDNPSDGPKELSLVGVAACSTPICGVTSIAASADKPLKEILHDEHLSASDRDCLLFGRMMKDTLVGDVVSYERQLGIVTDVKLAADSCKQQSPFALQDRKESLLNTLKKKQKTDTQCSVDVEAMLSAETWEEPIPDTEQDRQSRLKDILEKIRS